MKITNAFMLTPEEKEFNVGSALHERGHDRAIRRQQTRARTLKKATSDLNSRVQHLRAELKRVKSEQQRERHQHHTQTTVAARARRELEAEVRHYKVALGELEQAVERERDVAAADTASQTIGAAWRAKQKERTRRKKATATARRLAAAPPAAAPAPTAPRPANNNNPPVVARVRGWASFLAGISVACGLATVAALALRTGASPRARRSHASGFCGNCGSGDLTKISSDLN